MLMPIARALAAGGAGLAAMAMMRQRARERALEAELAERLPLGPSGVILGAEPLSLAGSATHGALVLHGFGDTPQSVSALARHIHALGWSVEAPLLPGHGRTLQAFGAATADEWLAFARDEAARMATRHRHVALIGLSLGAALCAAVAARATSIRALVLLAPYLSMPRRIRSIARVLRAAGPLTTFHRSTSSVPSIQDPDAAARSIGFGATSGHLLAELYVATVAAQRELPTVRVPTLYIASRNDNRIPAASAAQNWELVRAPERELVWLEGSGHIITVDYEREEVFRRTAAWLTRYAGKP